MNLKRMITMWKRLCIIFSQTELGSSWSIFPGRGLTAGKKVGRLHSPGIGWALHAQIFLLNLPIRSHLFSTGEEGGREMWEERSGGSFSLKIPLHRSLGTGQYSHSYSQYKKKKKVQLNQISSKWNVLPDNLIFFLLSPQLLCLVWQSAWP